MNFFEKLVFSFGLVGIIFIGFYVLYKLVCYFFIWLDCKKSNYLYLKHDLKVTDEKVSILRDKVDLTISTLSKQHYELYFKVIDLEKKIKTLSKRKK